MVSAVFIVKSLAGFGFAVNGITVKNFVIYVPDFSKKILP